MSPTQLKVLLPAISAFCAALANVYWPEMAHAVDVLAAAVTAAVLVRRPGDGPLPGAHPDDLRG
jgi:hypothetical protein